MNLLFILSFLIFGNGDKIQKQELLGKHWAGSYTSASCDTISFYAFKKYDPQRYQWGGYGEGFEFHTDGSAQEFNNVMCSDESSPESSFISKWSWSGKDTLVIDDPYMTTKYQILLLNKKKLQLKMLEFHSKEIK